MSKRPPLARATAIALALAAVPSIAAIATGTSAASGTAVASGGDGHDRDAARLVGRAVLPVETSAPGPVSGAFFAPQRILGIQFPLPSQPVEGISAVVEGRHRGEYLAMPDNGFGTKDNSRDFLIRAYYVEPDFKRAGGGTGDIVVGDHISFRDPDGLIGFEIVNEGTPERLLTGGDIDPESLQRGRHGDLWVGDEFGPWILHFDADGRLLDPPFAMPDGIVSPANPWLEPGATPTHPGSGGLEGMAITPDGRFLYAVLEKATSGDPADARRVYEFDTRREAFTAPFRWYRTSIGTNLVSDVQSPGRHKIVLIERDGGFGLTALFRSVFEVNLRRSDRTGYLRKSEVLDLTAIPDPDGVSLPAIHDGDVGLGDPFRVTCESVEALRLLARDRILVGCDNNFPKLGRNPNLADDTELIIVDL